MDIQEYFESEIKKIVDFNLPENLTWELKVEKNNVFHIEFKETETGIIAGYFSFNPNFPHVIFKFIGNFKYEEVFTQVSNTWMDVDGHLFSDILISRELKWLEEERYTPEELKDTLIKIKAQFRNDHIRVYVTLFDAKTISVKGREDYILRNNSLQLREKIILASKTQCY